MTDSLFGAGTEKQPTLLVQTHPARPVVNMPAPVLGEPERCSCGSRFDDGRHLITEAARRLAEHNLEGVPNS